ncbi:hypothetical protein KPH14_004224 [Odynerus spinipes]|uniref:Translation initiation factor 3 N-terminal domain-containing protein n=1 Tax=Odynerus spinipes TaxID=1348599 RepID=A0AAD9VVB3_9HYME|nr:hypothetical protein KPH14_004224 [Odynerus spinipes]
MATVFLSTVLKARSLVRLKRFLPSLLNNNYKQPVRNTNILRYSSIPDNAITNINESNDDNMSEKLQKKVQEAKITLLLPDNSMLITDLENAKKISKRRGLVLIKVEEIQKKTSRATYKLVNQTEHLQEELESDDNNEKENIAKSTKTIQISSKITIHDLQVKLKNINKLLDKKHKIKIILANGSNIQDKVIKSIETSAKNHGTIQKVIKSSSTIFTILPHLDEHDGNNIGDINVNKERKGLSNIKPTR